MSEIQTEQTEIKAPRKQKRHKATAKVAKPAKDSPFAGITAKDCPSGCTEKRCVISTVSICKHPYKSSVNGCGPVTLENREKARKLIKHQMVDATG